MLLAPIIGGVLVATVYVRFHYALDTVAGLLVAIVVVTALTSSFARRRMWQSAASA